MTASRVKGLRREVGTLVRFSLAAAKGQTSKTKSGQSFVIFGPARSGSTLLVSLLNGHPDIHSLNEPLHDPTFSPIGLMERKFAMMDTPYRGFKLLDEHLTELLTPAQIKRVREWLIAKDMKIIHLQRENFLRQALSTFYAQARGGAWHSDRQNADKKVKMTVDPNALIAWMDQIDDRWAWRAEFLDGFKVHDVSYEKDLSTPETQQATLDRLLVEAFGLQSVPAASELRPVTPKGFDSFVANWPEVADALAKTRYADMMDDPAS